MAKNWAIIIGINSYDHLHPDDHLKYAVHDATCIQEFLCGKAGFNPNDVVLCNDNSKPVGQRGEIPTRPIRSNLRRLLLYEVKRAERADNLWFFFSGHGRTGKDNHDYLMPSDSYFNDLETAISTDFVIRCLMNCRAKNIVMALDMCRSFSGTKGINDLGGDTAKNANQQGIITIFSCQPGEASCEIAELKQGTFTYALLEGLARCETPRLLEKYLQQRVPELTDRYRKRLQVPQVSLNSSYKYDLPLLNIETQQNPSSSGALLDDSIAGLDTQKGDNTRGVAGHQIKIPLLSGTKLFEFEVITIDGHGKKVDRRREEAQYLIEGIDDFLEMVVIPSGTFLMGSSLRKPSSNEIPTHLVTIKPFLMSKYPITKIQWKLVADLPQVHQKLRKLPFRSGVANHPVVNISWHDAVEFCNRLSKKTGYEYSLPTEAQWEYACRATTTTPFHFGATITSEIANYDGNLPYHSEGKGINRGKLTQVDMFQFANAFGLFDMHGNVWEWCQDSWHESYKNAPSNGEAWLDNGKENTNRVMRGGSWINEAFRCRSACRQFGNSHHPSDNTGFRIIRSVN